MVCSFESTRKMVSRGMVLIVACVLLTTMGCSDGKEDSENTSVGVSVESSEKGNDLLKTDSEEKTSATAEFQIISGIEPGEKNELAKSGAQSENGDEISLEEAIRRDFEEGMKNALDMEKTDSEGASRAYQALTADYPNRFEPYHRLALLFEAAQDQEAAIALYEEALRMNPASAVFFNDFGWYLYSVHEYERAAAMLQKALSLDAGNPKYITNLALTTAELGRWEEAFALFQKAPGAKSFDSYSAIAAIQLKQASNALEKEDISAGKLKLEMAKENLRKIKSLTSESSTVDELQVWAEELDGFVRKLEEKANMNSEEKK